MCTVSTTICYTKDRPWLPDLDPEILGARGTACLLVIAAAEYNFTVIHKPGTQHGNVDALSRIPCRQCGRDNHYLEDITKEV